MNLSTRSIVISIFFLTLFTVGYSSADGQKTVPVTLRGATVYVPVYSQIYHGDRMRPFNLAVTVSLRNSDSSVPVTISRAEYFDAQGKLVRNLLAGPIALMPLHSSELKIRESEIGGGSGGSIIVKWSSQSPASPLLVEAIMIGTISSQGISFSSRGQITSFEP